MRYQYLIQYGKAVHIANQDYSKPLCNRKGTFTPMSRKSPYKGKLCDGCKRKQASKI